MAKVISLSARLQKGKGSASKEKTPTLPPALKPMTERVDVLEKNSWTIVAYVEELEERVSDLEKSLLKLLRLLKEAESLPPRR